MGEARALIRFSVDDFYAQYPRLAGDPDHRITSEATDVYNCVAWVQRDQKHWIDPELFWPAGVPKPAEDEDDLRFYVNLFKSWGFEEAESPDLEDGFLKIAIFATDGEFDHVAKQLPSGRWSSKGGKMFDFRHRLDSVGACLWMPDTELAVLMRRPHDGLDKFDVEENGLIL